MRRLRRYASTLCRALLVVLVFAQAAFAAAPCLDGGMSPAAAFSGEAHDCCPTAEASSPNVCLLECNENGQATGQTAAFAATAAPSAPMLTLPSAPPGGVVRELPERCAVHDPPKSIRFCTFLI